MVLGLLLIIGLCSSSFFSTTVFASTYDGASDEYLISKVNYLNTLYNPNNLPYYAYINKSNDDEHSLVYYLFNDFTNVDLVCTYSDELSDYGDFSRYVYFSDFDYLDINYISYTYYDDNVSSNGNTYNLSFSGYGTSDVVSASFPIYNYDGSLAWSPPLDYSSDEIVNFVVSPYYDNFVFNWTVPNDVVSIGIKISSYDDLSYYGFKHYPEYVVSPNIINWTYENGMDGFDLNNKYYVQAFFYDSDVNVLTTRTIDNLTFGAFDNDEFIKNNQLSIDFSYVDDGLQVTALVDMDINYSLYEVGPSSGGLLLGSNDSYSSDSDGIFSLSKDDFFIIPYKSIIPDFYDNVLKIYARNYGAIGKKMSLIFDGTINESGSIDDSHKYGQNVETTQYYDGGSFDDMDISVASGHIDDMRNEALNGLKAFGVIFSMLPYPFNMLLAWIVSAVMVTLGVGFVLTILGR